MSNTGKDFVTRCEKFWLNPANTSAEQLLAAEAELDDAYTDADDGYWNRMSDEALDAMDERLMS